MITRNYNQDWAVYFQLDTSSPSGLVRIKNRVGKDIEKYNVGSKMLNKKGVSKGWYLNFKGSGYYIHRIIWALTYGTIDSELIVDHLDGNPFNNSVDNLRLKTLLGNSMNKRKHKNNSTGTTGVKILISPDGFEYYSAQWHDLNGVRKQKLFSIAILGGEAAKASAITYREQQITLLNSQGAGYSERHGK